MCVAGPPGMSTLVHAHANVLGSKLSQMCVGGGGGDFCQQLSERLCIWQLASAVHGRLRNKVIPGKLEADCNRAVVWRLPPADVQSQCVHMS